MVYFFLWWISCLKKNWISSHFILEWQLQKLGAEQSEAKTYLFQALKNAQFWRFSILWYIFFNLSVKYWRKICLFFSPYFAIMSSWQNKPFFQNQLHNQLNLLIKLTTCKVSDFWGFLKETSTFNFISYFWQVSWDLLVDPLSQLKM